MILTSALVCKGRGRRDEFELAESLNGDAQGNETETGAEPGEEGALGSEVVARRGTRVLEDGGAEAREHLEFVTIESRRDLTIGDECRR